MTTYIAVYIAVRLAGLYLLYLLRITGEINSHRHNPNSMSSAEHAGCTSTIALVPAVGELLIFCGYCLFIGWNFSEMIASLIMMIESEEQ